MLRILNTAVSTGFAMKHPTDRPEGRGGGRRSGERAALPGRTPWHQLREAPRLQRDTEQRRDIS